MPVQTPLPPNYLKNNETDGAKDRERSGNSEPFHCQNIARQPASGPYGYRDRPGGFVYFIGDGQTVKIGFSFIPSDRISSLAASHPTALETLAVIPGSYNDEAFLHHRMRHLRMNGEWFRAHGDLNLLIADLEGCRAEIEAGRQTITSILRQQDEWADLAEDARYGANANIRHIMKLRRSETLGEHYGLAHRAEQAFRFVRANKSLGKRELARAGQTIAAWRELRI